MHVSERRACAALGQHRSTQRKVPRGREDEKRLTADTIALARQYGRYGYRKIAGLLEQAGWLVNDKRVERIWRREGLKVPHKQPKRGRLWLSDGSCIRLRPEHRNHVLEAARTIAVNPSHMPLDSLDYSQLAYTPSFLRSGEASWATMASTSGWESASALAW